MEKKMKEGVVHFTVSGFRVMENNAMIRLSVAVDRGRGLRRMPERIRLKDEERDELMDAVGQKVIEMVGKKLGDATYLSREDFDALFVEEA